jgi:hypothetical protein
MKSGNKAAYSGKKSEGSLNMKMKDFEEGKLTIPNLSISYTYARMILEFEPYYKEFHRGIFTSCMLPMFKSKVYNHREMIYKLSVAPIRLMNCATVSAYRLLLEDIYNWKRQKESKVSFRNL